MVTFDSCDIFYNEMEEFKGERVTCSPRTSKATHICVFEGIMHETRSKKFSCPSIPWEVRNAQGGGFPRGRC